MSTTCCQTHMTRYTGRRSSSPLALLQRTVVPHSVPPATCRLALTLVAKQRSADVGLASTLLSQGSGLEPMMATHVHLLSVGPVVAVRCLSISPVSAASSQGPARLQLNLPLRLQPCLSLHRQNPTGSIVYVSRQDSY